jgi:hypothetical protein
VCGRVQQLSRQQCGAPLRSRQHLVSDFLIGAHAAVQADRLLTREELDTAEDIAPLEPHKIYYLPTPYNTFGAGRALMQAMQQTDSHTD